MLTALDENRFQRREDVATIADLDQLQRVHGVDDSARSDRHPRRAQGAGKAHDVVGDVAGWRCQMIDGHRPHSIHTSFQGGAPTPSTLMVRSASSRVSNHEARLRPHPSRRLLRKLLRMRVSRLLHGNLTDRPGMTFGQTSLVASFKTFCKPSPCIRAMSSWYFRSAPSVSPTTCGVSDRASSSESAVAQSMVSATPGDL